MNTIGIDEAGRGALAGPVVVAAVGIPKGFKYRSRGLPKLRDSKKLSSTQREFWYQYLLSAKGVCFFACRVYQNQIDRNNITRCANLAASRAVEKLVGNMGRSLKSLKILLDGGLYLGEAKHSGIKTSTLIRGDERIVAIKLASIVAKVTRDRYMRKLHLRHPQYNFLKNKGYGTKEHFGALKKSGISEVHRLTYLTRYSNLKQKKSRDVCT